MSDRANAHFQHPARALEAVLTPPVPEPRAMAWRGEELLVLDAAGVLHHVEPSFGSRRGPTLAREATRIAASPAGADEVAVLDRDGVLGVYTVDGAPRWRRPTGVLGAAQLVFEPDHIVVVGDTAELRRVWVFTRDGATVARARVPARTLAVPRAGGLPDLVRSLPDGLRAQPFGAPLGSGRATEHHLLLSSGQVIGVASGGVTLWRGPSAVAVTVKLYDVVNAALSPDGDTVALATREGGVAVTVARPGVPRVNPGRVSGHDAPITGLAFAPRGPWLASLAERVWIWSA